MSNRQGGPRPQPTESTFNWWNAALGLCVIFGVVLIIMFGVYWASWSSWNGRDSWNCNDYNPCTKNLALPDSSCVTPPRIIQNYESCDHEDRCYFRHHERHGESHYEHWEHPHKKCF